MKINGFKIAVFFLAGVLILAAVPGMADSALKGDVNNDGMVTSTDLLLIEQHIVGTQTLNGQAFWNADINNDGDITTTDAMQLKRRLVDDEVKEADTGYDHHTVNDSKDSFLKTAYEQVGVYGNYNDNKFSRYTGTVGYAWCAPMVAWCANEAGVSCISHSCTYAVPWQLCTDGTIYILYDGKIKNDPYYTVDNNYYYNHRNNWDYLDRGYSFQLQPGDLIFLDNSGDANIDHVEIVYYNSTYINPTGRSTGYVDLESAYSGIIVAVARPNYADRSGTAYYQGHSSYYDYSAPVYNEPDLPGSGGWH